jgi:site-specific DNA-methyltransferase (adenine-specific)
MTEPWTRHVKIGDCDLYLGDCLKVMKDIPDGSVDMVLTDPPYGTTACKWDSVIPFEPMWEQLKRITKPNGAIVLTASQPFTSALIMSNVGMFRYELIWDKVNKYTGSLNANKMPLKRHENICVYYRKLPTYNKQMRDGKAYTATNSKGHGKHTQYGHDKDLRITVNTGKHNPCSVIEIKGDDKKAAGLHPTQKPVALMEYLIRTYTNEGETVLDFTMGSGTTGVACKNLGRSFIGIEMDADYFALASKRIQDAHETPTQEPLI